MTEKRSALAEARAEVAALTARVEELTAQLEAARHPLTLVEAHTLYRLLEFEAVWAGQADQVGKEDAIRRTLEMSPARYWQFLLAHLERPEAIAHAPQLVAALIRRRDAGRAARTRRYRGSSPEAGGGFV